MFAAGPEPLVATENSGVHFCRIPPQMRTGLKLCAAAEISACHVRPVEFLRRNRQRDDAPFRGSAHAAFVAYPAPVRPFAEDDRARLKTTDQIEPRRVVVSLANARIRIR